MWPVSMGFALETQKTRNGKLGSHSWEHRQQITPALPRCSDTTPHFLLRVCDTFQRKYSIWQYDHSKRKWQCAVHRRTKSCAQNNIQGILQQQAMLCCITAHHMKSFPEKGMGCTTDGDQEKEKKEAEWSQMLSGGCVRLDLGKSPTSCCAEKCPQLSDEWVVKACL